MKIKNAVFAGVLALTLGASSSAIALTYSFVDLGTLGGSYSSAKAINNAGQVVGSSFTAGSFVQHAAFWSGGTATDLGTLGGTSSSAYAINNVGQIVGQTRTSLGNEHATLWSAGSAVDLGTLGGRHSNAYGINDSGQVVGWANNSDGRMHATQWNGSTVTDLHLVAGFPSGDSHGTSTWATDINNVGQVTGNVYRYTYDGRYNVSATLWSSTTATIFTGGGADSFANAINDSGQVVGQAFGLGHATTWIGNTETSLGAGGMAISFASAINEAGQVVGYAYGSYENRRAVFWNGSTMIDINSLLGANLIDAGWVLTEANGINDSGWIVGDAFNSVTGQTHAFLLAPVPEPETYTMMLAGLGILGLTARRRRQKMNT